jgi:hypothetical protein
MHMPLLANTQEGKKRNDLFIIITQLMNNSNLGNINSSAAVNLGQMSNRILVRLEEEFMRLIKDRSGYCR